MIRIGVIGTAAIAERRMIPALKKEPAFEYAGASIATREESGFQGSEAEFEPCRTRKREKAARFQAAFGGQTYTSYEALLADRDIQAVYIALPPALHFHWAMRAVEAGKHVLMEKPFTTGGETTRKVVEAARKRGVALIENYGFVHHRQMEIIRGWLRDGAVGDLRLVRASFGFPHRAPDDFRYSRKLGGGALLDCGGYTLKAATAILGTDVEVISSASLRTEGHEVDMLGMVTVQRRDGICAQLAYGMDHAYRCELEIWGSKGIIIAPRAFTAPDGFEAPVCLKQGQEIQEKRASDDQFQRVVSFFELCMRDQIVRERVMEEILLQGRLTDQVRKD